MPRDPRSSRWTRREALHLMGAGAAGLSFVTACGGQPAPESPPGDAAAPTETAPSPQARIIRTLLDDISPDDITGVTLFHEHLSVKLSARMTATDDVDNIVQEIRTAATEGLGCIVDGGHPDMSRDLDACRRVANETDVHVVAAGGYYMERFYPPDLATKSDDQIADELVEEAIRDRLGAFGEIGQTSDVAEMTPLERKVFRAVGKAHVRSGIPIFTHKRVRNGAQRHAGPGTGPARPAGIGRRRPAKRRHRPRVLSRRPDGERAEANCGARRVRRLRPCHRRTGRRPAEGHDHSGVSRGRSRRSAAHLVRLHRATLTRAARLRERDHRLRAVAAGRRRGRRHGPPGSVRQSPPVPWVRATGGVRQVACSSQE